MYTQLFVRPWSKEALVGGVVSKVCPELVRSYMERRCEDIPGDRVVQSMSLALRMRRAAKRFPSGEAFFTWEADEVGKWIQRRGLGRANVLMGFVRNISPGLCGWARERGLVTVADQIIAPVVEEQRQWNKQLESWPGWEAKTRVEAFDLTREFEEQTWVNLDAITAMSPYVRDTLVEAGVSRDKVTVIPYTFDAQVVPFVDRSSPSASRSEGLVTVGFIGSVGLRKGVQFISQVARRVRSGRVRFVVVGGCSLTPAGVAELKSSGVEVRGRIQRSEVHATLAGFDVFFFPSTCEGSAGSVMEAMSSGLPVLVTPNTGSVAVDGVEGFVRSYDDLDGMAAAIEKLVSDRGLRLSMGLAARRRIEGLNFDWYVGEIGRLLRELVNGRGN